MMNGYRFRLYPNKDQQQILRRWVAASGSSTTLKCMKIGSTAAFSDRWWRRRDCQSLLIKRLAALFLGKRPFSAKSHPRFAKRRRPNFAKPIAVSFRNLASGRSPRKNREGRQSGSPRSFLGSSPLRMRRSGRAKPTHCMSEPNNSRWGCFPLSPIVPMPFRPLSTLRSKAGTGGSRLRPKIRP